jgi:uncharacterized membrane protein YhaH (DUF805 family)
MDWVFFLFTGRGRLNRAWFALYFLAYCVAFVAWNYILAYIVRPLLAAGLLPFTVRPVLSILAIAMLVPFLTFVVRRLHDRDKGGHWLIVFVALPVALIGAAGTLVDSPDTAMLGTLCGLLAFFVLIWGIVEVGLLPGTRGPNDFGADPRGGAEEVVPDLRLQQQPAQTAEKNSS